MALIQTVHLSMANFKSAPVVPAVQNDTDRQVKMIIDDYTLTSGLTGKIAFERSDGTHYETAAELVLADNAFVADIDQALTQPGRTMVQLKVTDTMTVSTFSFVIFVEADNSGTVTPQESIDLVTAVEAAEAAADRAESAASTLELDATLTSATKAAQAKAVGDAIGEVKSALIYTNDTVGVYNVKGTATQASKYTDTVAVDNITFDAYCKYNIRLSNANPITVKTYGYLKDANGNVLMPCNIEANESTATHEYFSTQDMTGCKVTFQAGVNNVTVSVDVLKNISIQQDMAEYEQVLNLNTHSGYIKVNGTTGTATEYAEVYTDYINVDLINKIRYSLIYPTANVLWLKACVKYKDGTFARLDITDAYGDFAITSTIDSVAFTYRTYGQCDFRAVAIGLKNGDLSETIAEVNVKATTAIKKALIAYNNPFDFLPCWDHLFVSRSTTWVTIPHESLFHVRISKLFGAKVIEANLWKTSDGVFIVNHLASGKFGGYFHHVDGTTDISNMGPSDVTWDWIVSNLRYNSRIAKYQTRPPRLEEFLAECKQQNIIPMITANDADAVAIIRQYFGNSYIAYDGNRATSPDNYIFQWKGYATKEAIIEYCDSIGAPLIYGISNIADFSEAELKDIIDALHAKGYLTCCAYVYDNWAKYSSYGIDVNASIQQINRLQNGNICNFESLYGFDNYTFTNATETDGILTFSADGTIEPNIPGDVLDICAVDLELLFSGSITIPIFGEHINATTITSDGTQPYFQCTPIIGGSPKVIINVSKDTVIYDMKYKATRI